MSASGTALAAAAESLVGTPFRLHGRDPDFGLDCVGLVEVALDRIGRTVQPPSGYRLRQRDQRIPRPPGFMAPEGPTQPGDLLLVRPGAAQHHLLVASVAGGFIHAHAGLRRVVHSPAPLAWPVLRHWRLES